jgi:hypothetical protein
MKKKDNKLSINIVKILIGITVGGSLGYLLYRFVGCSTGSCPITSNPWISTIYGAILGLLIVLL